MTAYRLEKGEWTDSDFGVMGWHDCHIHAFAFDSNAWKMSIDLDYIFQWVEPAPPETYYRFWVAPATMVFENAHSVTMDFCSHACDLEIDGLLQLESKPTPDGEGSQTLYRFDCHEGAISLWATGFRMTVRQVPVLTAQQVLALADRGGVSFDTTKLAT